MKRFLDYMIEKEEWRWMKPSDLPPLNKDYVAKKEAEKKEAGAATKEVKSKLPKEVSGSDTTQMDMPQVDKPGSYEGEVRYKYRMDASTAGTRFVKPTMPGDEIPQAYQKKPVPSFGDTPTIKDPAGTADKGIESGKIAPPDHPSTLKNPSRRARTKT